MISIITLHRVKNYGSVLQAYALEKKILELGYKVQTIDYYPKRLTMKGMLSGIKNKNPRMKNICFRNAARIIILPSYIKRFSVFHNFIEKNLNLTKTYNDENQLKEANFESKLFITGSDQVWNSAWNEKFEAPFYLTFVKYAKKVAYAASFGKSKLDEKEKNEIYQALNEYSDITVRENSGCDILKDINLEANVVADPTLLLTRQEWTILSSNKFNGKKYILVYNLNRDKKLWNFARKISLERNLPIYYISYNLHDVVNGAKMLFCPKVNDFISLFENATVVITDSFHATAFSINFNRDFYVLYPSHFSTRIKSILDITNLNCRVVDETNPFVEPKIDFTEANKKLSDFRKKSFDRLKKMVEDNYDE